ncbi:MAG: hypothetical protein Q9178_004566 [Gyalolechia marmorata]
MAPTNYSIYSIPIYFLINFIPHTYSTLIVSNGSPKNWDNANPKSTVVREKFQKRVSAATFTRWERARAAHNNGIENFPLLIAAVILGNMARIDAGTLNWTFGSFLALRAIFIVAYIGISDRRLSYFRTVVFNISVFQCLWILFKAGNVILRQFCVEQMHYQQQSKANTSLFQKHILPIFSAVSKMTSASDSPYSEKYHALYNTLFEHQGVLKSYLATLYNERHALMARLHKAQNPNSDDEPRFEIPDRPTTTLTELDELPNGQVLDVNSALHAEVRNARRLIRVLEFDIEDMEGEIESLEVGNEALKLKLEGAELFAEHQRLRATMGDVVDLEGSSGMSSGLSSQMDEEMDGIAPSIENDDYADFERAEQERMEFGASEAQMTEYLKALESQMAENVKTRKRQRAVDEDLIDHDVGVDKGKGKEKLVEDPDAGESQNGKFEG